MTPEGKIKKKVKEVLDQHGCWHNWPVPAGYGIPMLDCVGCYNGLFFAIETKTLGEELTPRQEFTKEAMELAGAKVFVIKGEVENNPDTWFGWIELTDWLYEHRNRK